MRDDNPKSWESRADWSYLYGFTDLPSIHERGQVIVTHGEGPYPGLFNTQAFYAGGHGISV